MVKLGGGVGDIAHVFHLRSRWMVRSFASRKQDSKRFQGKKKKISGEGQ